MAVCGDNVSIPDLLIYLEKYRWIWDVKLTELFLNDHLTQNFPRDWVDVMTKWSIDDLNNLLFTHTKSFLDLDLPISLKNFIEQSHYYSLPIDTVPLDIKCNSIPVTGDMVKKMKAKKQHEVSRLAGLVNKVCRQSDCQSVLDIGSGLSYLGQCLTHYCKLNVTCIERDIERISSSNTRADQLQLQMNYVQLTVDDSDLCIDNIQRLISTSNVCITGLHCCGNLSTHMLKIFTSTTAMSIVLIPCCYHKLSVPLPISHSLQKYLTDYGSSKYLSVYGLRLAAQNTFESWTNQSIDDHLLHTNRVAFRAIVEVVLQNDIFKLVASKVSLLLRKLNYKTFDNFVDSFVELIKQESPNMENETVRDLLTDAYYKFNPSLLLIEPFTALQVCMQKSLEVLVLYDYQMYLKERGIDTELVTVFDHSISPRCTAIIGTRK